MPGGKSVIKRYRSQKLLVCVVCMMFLVFCSALTVSLAIFRSDKSDVQQNSFGAVVLHDNSQYKYKSKIQNKLVGEEYLFNDIKLTVADNTSPVFIRAHVYFDSTNEVAKDKIKFNSFSIKNHENYTWSRFGDYWYLCDKSGNLMQLNSTKAGEVYVFLIQSDAVVPEMQGVLGDDEFVSCEIVVQSSLASNFSNTTNFSEINKSFDKNATETTKTGTYSVVFKQNGATLSTQTINYGGKATIPEVTTAEGDVFLCWNTREDGSGANITNEQLGYITQNLTLFPMFENQKVLVTVVQSEGGTISPETQMVDWGSDLVMHFIPNKNYVLKRILIDGDPVGAASEYLLKRITGAVVVSAEFVSDYIVLDINGGAGEQPNVVYNGDQTKFMLEGNEPTKSGKEFYYYSTNSADNEQGQNGDRYDLGYWYDVPNTSGTTTLFAIYLTPSSNYQTAQNYVVVPKNVSAIADSAVNMFSGTNNTVKFVTLPRQTSKIGKNAFANCSGLVGVSMSDFVTSIGESAFKSDSALTNFRAPTSLQILGKAAFSGCGALAKVTNLDATSISEIPNDCFGGCSQLEEVILPVNLVRIGESAFVGAALKTLNLEETKLEELGSSAFNSCSALTQVTVPSTLKTMGQAVFMFSGITKVKNFAGTSVSSLEKWTFWLSSLIQIELPETLEIINEQVFASCSELTRVGGLQNTKVTQILDDAFSGCSKLKNVIFPQTLLTLGGGAYSGCSALTSVTFNSNLKTIGANAFEGCSSLSQLTGFEKTVVSSIGANAFKGCSSLVDVSLPNTIQTVGANAFANCSGLATINFINDSNLSTLSVAANSFTGTTSDLKVNILDESHFDEYISKLNGKGFAENAFMFFLGNIDRKAYYKNAVWEKFRDAVITSTAGEHGTISPSGTIIYSLGSSASYVISPETGYKIKKILVDGVEIVVTAADGAAQRYEFDDIQKDHTILAEFEQRMFKITVVCGGNGKIEPSTTKDYAYGSEVAFVITPNDGYVIKDVLIDGVSNAKAKENAKYTFSNLRANHKIEVSFEVVTFTIVSSVGEGGTMSPNQITTIKNWGENHSVTYTPNDKFVISTIVVDGQALNLSGVDVSKPYTYTFSKITANHVISCQFESTQRTLTYDPNGGTFADGDSSKTQEYNAFSNQTITLISTNPTRIGYKFKSWNTMSDGSGKGNSDLAGKIYSSVFGKEDGWLYAIWEIKQFTITTEAGAHGTITESMTVDWGTTATVEMKPDEGYRVATYSIDGGNAINSTTKAGDSDYFTFRNIAANHKISVTFAPITYTIKYNGNGATSGSTADSDHTYDEEKELTANGFSRTGYNFAGWATKDAIAATNATAVTNGTYLTGNVGSGSDSIGEYFTKDASSSTQWWAGVACRGYDVTAGLTYIWTIEVYHEMGKTMRNQMDANVSYPDATSNDDAYEGSVITPQQIPSGVWTTLTIRVKIKAGFTGTYIHHSFSPQNYVDGTNFSTPAKIYYRNSRIVEFATDPPEYMNCQKVKNLSKVQGDVVELYAVWAANQYTVTFNPNGGTVSPTSQTVVYGQAYNEISTLPTPTRTGYSFAGWGYAMPLTKARNTILEDNYTIKSGSKHDDTYFWVNAGYTLTVGTKYVFRFVATVDPNNNWLFAPQNKEPSYRLKNGYNEIEFTAQDAPFFLDDKNCDEAHPFTITDASIQAVTTNEIIPVTTTKYISGATTVQYASNHALYAQWTPKTYHVTYNPNGGNGSVHTHDIVYDGTFVLLDPTDNKLNYSRDDHAFDYWSMNQDGSDISWKGWIGREWTWTYDHDVTFYAQWNRNYHIIYHANGGSGATMSETIVANGQHCVISQNTYTKTGYQFDHWAELYPDGTYQNNGWTDWSGTWKYANGQYSISDYKLNLYAIWTPITYTVTANANGGTIPATTGWTVASDSKTATKTVTFDSTYETLPTPTKTGYTFDGWAGKNLFDKSATAYKTGAYLRGADGVEVGYSAYNIYQIPVPAGATITIKNSGKSSAPGYAFYTAGGVYISGANYGERANVTVTVPSNAMYIRVSVNLGEEYRKDIDYFQIEIGSSATAYEAYRLITSSTVVKTPNNHILTAIWTANKITITLNKNGGSGGTDKIYFKYNTNTFYSDANCTTIITKITPPTRIGHTFYRYTGDGTCGGTNGEWFIDTDGTFANDLHYDIYKDATLTAQWTKVSDVTGSATMTFGHYTGYYSGYSGTVTCGGFDVEFTYQNARGKGTYCAVYCTALGDTYNIEIPGKNDYDTSFSNATVSGSQCTYTVSWNASTKVATITISF